MVWPMLVITIVQGALALRVFSRMARTARGSRIEPVAPSSSSTDRVSIIVPALNEQDRLAPCLDGLMMQGEIVEEIRIVDGGSTDATRSIAERSQVLDPRVHIDDASPVPAGVNGKSYGLTVASAHLHPASAWILVIDADVRPAAGLVDALVAKATAEKIDALSVATRQSLSGWAEGFVHPSMLATLVYRFGIPGHIAHRVEDVQANGQCFLVRRSALEKAGGFASVVNANAEDVTLARSLVLAGYPVGFFEANDLVSVQMYASWREAWAGWARSLPMRDQYSTWKLPLSLAEVFLVQAAPLPLWVIALVTLGFAHPLTMVQTGLLLGRIGVLAGMRRAYTDPPMTYWLSPLVDLGVAFRLCDMARRRRFVWRGRVITPGDYRT